MSGRESAGGHRHSIAYPTNHVVGTVSDPGNAQAAVAALLEAGFVQDDIDILHGEEALKRLDPTGVEHGFLAQFHRTMIRAFDLEEFKHLTHHVDDVRAGRFVIMVLIKKRVQRIVAADVLNRHGAEFVGFYGRWAWEALPAAPHRSPEEIPGLFVRAWNNRDSDALASLFDEDGEFVHVSGLCCHDRESIRKAHQDGEDRIYNNSILTIDETKVKRLSPDVAVVHARMTCSCKPGDRTGQPGPHSTIVSFVVHRIVHEWWQCASVHNTDVVPGTETTAIHEAGVPGLAAYPPPRMT